VLEVIGKYYTQFPMDTTSLELEHQCGKLPEILEKPWLNVLV